MKDLVPSSGDKELNKKLSAEPFLFKFTVISIEVGD